MSILFCNELKEGVLKEDGSAVAKLFTIHFAPGKRVWFACATRGTSGFLPVAAAVTALQLHHTDSTTIITLLRRSGDALPVAVLTLPLSLPLSLPRSCQTRTSVWSPTSRACATTSGSGSSRKAFRRRSTSWRFCTSRLFSRCRTASVLGDKRSPFFLSLLLTRFRQ